MLADMGLGLRSFDDKGSDPDARVAMQWTGRGLVCSQHDLGHGDRLPLLPQPQLPQGHFLHTKTRN